MRIAFTFAASLYVTSLYATAVAAQPVDCNAIKTTLVPYEIRFGRDDNNKSVLQMYRDASGDYVAWFARQTPNMSTISKAVVSPGQSSTTSIEGRPNGSSAYTVTNDITWRGLPKKFDWASDVTFQAQSKFSDIKSDGGKPNITYKDGNANLVYKYVSTQRINIGSCLFAANIGYVTIPVEGRPTPFYQTRIYFPEISATVVDDVAQSPPEQVLLKFAGIETSFQQMAFEPGHF
jgi:hypothetical protein